MRGFLMCFKHEFMMSMKPLFFTYLLGFIPLLILLTTEPVKMLPWPLETALVFLCGLSFLAFACLLVVRVFQTFWGEIFGQEGYLTLTLPVSLDAILLSKIFVYTLWVMLSFIFGFGLFWLLNDPSFFQHLIKGWYKAVLILWSWFVGILYSITFVLFITTLLNALRVRTFVLFKGLLLALMVNVPLSVCASTLESFNLNLFGLSSFILSCVCYGIARYLITHKLELE